MFDAGTIGVKVGRGNAPGEALVGGKVLADERGRFHKSGLGHGIGREQLAQTGGRLLGNRRFLCSERRREREAFLPSVVLRSSLFHICKNAALPGGASRENEQSRIVSQHGKSHHVIENRAYAI